MAIRDGKHSLASPVLIVTRSEGMLFYVTPSQIMAADGRGQFQFRSKAI